MIHHGDLFDVLPTLDAESIDACVTDPPYGIGFMGREWDNFRRRRNMQDVGRDSVMGRLSRSAPASGAETDRHAFEEWCEQWGREVYRVLKPGAHILACGACRNYHRMASGLEDAGFEIRDCLAWLFGSGFPKSLNLGEGLGTALKPAHEPIVLARKPLIGSVRSNVAKHGTGALNIDACRIESGPDHADKCASVVGLASNRNGNCYGEWTGEREDSYSPLGRWPANVCLDEQAAMVLDEQSGELPAGVAVNRNREPGTMSSWYGKRASQTGEDVGYGDTGGASRFFYIAKPSREERDIGCYGLPSRSGGEATDRTDGSAELNNPRAGAGRTGGARNFHPTVKPIELMRWLVRLVTPPNGVVLDPFTGSGTTGMACRYELRRFIGVEREADYIAIAERRIAAVAPLFGDGEVA
jgi:DNA modification methylase